jgi:hypothetical protein
LSVIVRTAPSRDVSASAMAASLTHVAGRLADVPATFPRTTWRKVWGNG